MHAQEAHRGASHLMDNNKNKEMEVGNSRCYREIKTIRMFCFSRSKYIVGSGEPATIYASSAQAN